MNRHFAALQKGLAADATLAGRAKLISITFDPEYDTPAVLADFAAKHDSDPAVWTWLTGDRVTTDRLAAKFGVGLIREKDTPTEVIHNLRTTLVDGAGRVVKIYSGSDWTPAAVLADIRGVLAR
jgi:protein SCO1/2